MTLPRFALSRSALRPWAAGDLPALLRHADDPEVSRHMTDRFPYPYTRADAERWLAYAAAAGRDTNLAIEVGGEAAGGIGFIPGRDERRLRAEVGYWLGRAYWGRGIVTEALAALSAHLLAREGLERLEAVVYESNPASARVLEKAGYALESVQRRGAIKRGRVLDVLLYVRLA